MNRLPFLLACLAALSFPARAAEVKVAVAANFSAPMQQLAAQFERQTGHKAVLSVGATGKFYAQISHGAPFDVLLAADDETPARLAREGKAVASSGFTYATGRLVLWSATPGYVNGPDTLRRPDLAHLALANPATAPYGAAAVEVLKALGQYPQLQPRFVLGENLAQTYQFAATGNAQAGFVALAQVIRDGKIGSGSAWIVPATLHAPIRQDAILLAAGKDNPAAQSLLAYLKTEPARQLMRSFGYEF